MDIFHVTTISASLHDLFPPSSQIMNSQVMEIFPIWFIHFLTHTLFSCIHFSITGIYHSIAIHSDRVSYRLKVCGNSASSKSIGSVFPIALAPFWVLVSHFGDCHNISNFFIIVYLLLWSSVMSDFFMFLVGLNEGSEDGWHFLARKLFLN